MTTYNIFLTYFRLWMFTGRDCSVYLVDDTTEFVLHARHTVFKYFEKYFNNCECFLLKKPLVYTRLNTDSLTGSGTRVISTLLLFGAKYSWVRYYLTRFIKLRISNRILWCAYFNLFRKYVHYEFVFSDFFFIILHILFNSKS